MGNFIVNLGKGFIRSAVNQVGRDGGRVISNKIYGDAHATPIRGVALNNQNKYFDEITQEEINPEELRKRCEEEGFKPSICKYGITIKVIWYLIALMFSWAFIPSIVLFIKAFKKINQKSVYMRKAVTVANYVSDRRYKSGQRLNGYSSEAIEIKVPANIREKKSSTFVGITYIILSAILFYIGMGIINASYSKGNTDTYETQSTIIDSTLSGSSKTNITE